MYITDKDLLHTFNLHFGYAYKIFKRIKKKQKTAALKTDAEYHTENHQSPQYVDILDITYVTMGRLIWHRQLLMRLCLSYY